MTHVYLVNVGFSRTLSNKNFRWTFSLSNEESQALYNADTPSEVRNMTWPNNNACWIR